MNENKKEAYVYASEGTLNSNGKFVSINRINFIQL